MCTQNELNMGFARGKVGPISTISLYYSLANLVVTTQVHTSENKYSIRNATRLTQRLT